MSDVSKHSLFFFDMFSVFSFASLSPMQKQEKPGKQAYFVRVVFRFEVLTIGSV